MSRKASGTDVLENAKKLAAEAESANELRMALTVILPVEFGLSLEQVAGLVGKSVSWVSRSRREIIEHVGDQVVVTRQGHGGRRNQVLSEDDELPFMMNVCRQYELMRHLGAGSGEGRISAKNWFRPFQFHVKEELEKRAGRSVSMATTYNIMRRAYIKKFGEKGSWRWKLFRGLLN